MSLPPVRLCGPRPRLDPRSTVVRGDVVDIDLAPHVAAGRYTVPLTLVCIRPVAPMRGEPGADAVQVSELLHGESFDLFDTVAAGGEEWAFGRSRHDRYTGWVPRAALAEPAADPGPVHRVTARLAPVFAAPDIKAPVRTALPLGARVRGTAEAAFLACDGGGYIHRRHLWPSTLPGHTPLPTSAVETARAFLGAPYLWGGRTPQGVDCSGLVQAALALIGIAAPRDSDQQQASLGRPVSGPPQPGDLVFFPGHVGIMATPATLIHANAHWMTCCEEPLADVLARLGLAEPTAIRRL